MATKNKKAKPTAKSSKSSAKAKVKPTAKKSAVANKKKAEKKSTLPKVAKVKGSTIALESTTPIRPEPAKVQTKPAPTPKIMKSSKKAAEPLAKKGAEIVNAGDEGADPQWIQLRNQNRANPPVAYVMSDSYAPKTVINHKVLGLGFVLSSQNNRIEVQFKDGKKTLITNYKK